MSTDREVIKNPPGHLEPVKIAILNAVSWADADGDDLVIVRLSTGKVRSLSEAQFDAATGFGGLFEEGEG